MKLPTQHLLDENLEFINMRTCLTLGENRGGGLSKSTDYSSYSERNIWSNLNSREGNLESY